MSTNDDRGEPGLKYPEDIPKEVPVQLHKAMRMMVDNIYYLKKKVAQVGVQATAAATAETPPTTSGDQTTVGGSTSGYAVFSQPVKDKAYKKIVIYVDALLGTATYKFPTGFTQTPQILSQTLAAIVTTLSTTSVTVTGATSTGFIELSGY